jgi:hypothetical protein
MRELWCKLVVSSLLAPWLVGVGGAYEINNKGLMAQLIAAIMTPKQTKSTRASQAFGSGHTLVDVHHVLGIVVCPYEKETWASQLQTLSFLMPAPGILSSISEGRRIAAGLQTVVTTSLEVSNMRAGEYHASHNGDAAERESVTNRNNEPSQPSATWWRKEMNRHAEVAVARCDWWPEITQVETIRNGTALRIHLDTRVDYRRVLRKLLYQVQGLSARTWFHTDDVVLAEYIQGVEFARGCYTQTAAGVSNKLNLLMMHFEHNFDSTYYREPGSVLGAQDGRKGFFSAVYFNTFKSLGTVVSGTSRASNPFDHTDAVALGTAPRLFMECNDANLQSKQTATPEREEAAGAFALHTPTTVKAVEIRQSVLGALHATKLMGAGVRFLI